MLACFRCDANPQVGLGHLSRCTSLANAIAELGGSCVFVMRQPDKLALQMVEKNQHLAFEINIDSCEFDSFEDASACLKLLAGNGLEPNWIILDLYQADEQWATPFVTCKSKLMLLNDAGKPANWADCIWDTGTIDKDHYAAVSKQTTSKQTKLLLGPKYALLREEFQLKNSEAFDAGKSQRLNVLISIGATDPLNTAQPLIEWLLAFPQNLNLTLLSASSNPNLTELQNKFQNEPRINFAINYDQIAALMRQQQLIITAAGNMLWEAYSQGIPCAIVKTCDNQQRNITLITEQMPDVYLGDERQLDKIRVVHTLLDLLTSTDRLNALSKQVHSLCDGQGSKRVAQALFQPANKPC